MEPGSGVAKGAREIEKERAYHELEARLWKVEVAREPERQRKSQSERESIPRV